MSLTLKLKKSPMKSAIYVLAKDPLSASHAAPPICSISLLEVDFYGCSFFGKKPSVRVIVP